MNHGFDVAGLVIDDEAAEKKGTWGSGTGLKGYVNYGYLYSTDQNASARFRFKAPSAGKHEIRLAYQPHQNRGSKVPVTIEAGSEEKSLTINMKKPAPLEHGFISLGVFDFEKGQPCSVEIRAKDADGHAHVDAVQVLAIP